MALNVKQEILDNIIQTLNSATGDEVQNGMDNLARLVQENEGNEIMEKFNENCRKMQLSYNDYFVPATNALLSEYGTMIEFRSAIAKAASNMSETRTGTTSMQADKIEVPEI